MELEKFQVSLEDLAYWLDLAWARAKLGKRDARSPHAIFQILKREFLDVAGNVIKSRRAESGSK